MKTIAGNEPFRHNDGPVTLSRAQVVPKEEKRLLLLPMAAGNIELRMAMPSIVSTVSTLIGSNLAGFSNRQ
ncbi:hypothetical protein BLOT_003008 [Blomia tropicalis]|nr:hypothetical protein BLOT_003008 [Blomia tropicalis]